jgi:peptidoglycan/xylan/chitin deacetylase (PgdA/CDA1 family)
MLANIHRKVNKLLGFDKRFWKDRPNGVYSFNYHRIGDKESTSFDPNVFSCTEEMFEKHISFFQTNFDVVTTNELNELIKMNKSNKGKYAFLTFDDGYIDNYTIAYPILKQANCPATMFIATDFIDKPILPWWDEAAWLIKNNDDSIFLGLDWDLPSNISTLSVQNKVKHLLRSIKDNKTLSIEEKFTLLRNQATEHYKAINNSETLFMTWDMLREMSKNNIDIGSQTCSHQILSHLSEAEQHYEINHSKERIEKEIRKDVKAFAYPVGGVEAFTKITQKMVRDAGYEFALSFVPNINLEPNNNLFGMNRFSIDSECSTQDIQSTISLATQKLMQLNKINF